MLYLRRLPDFGYLSPKTVNDACSLLLRHRGQAKVMAGGTDLLVRMKKGREVPQFIIGLRGIPDLDYITYSEPEGLKMGALATFRSMGDSPVVREHFPFLVDVAQTIGSVQIQHTATIGGNLCNASHLADSAPMLIVLRAKVKLCSTSGERTVQVEDFFTGHRETVLKEDEILTEIQVPELPGGSGAVYLKLTPRTKVDVAAVGVAAWLLLDSENRVCRDIRIALGAVAPTPVRSKKAEQAVKGKELDDALIEQAVQLASDEARPISDIRCSASYRREMVKVLTARALKQAFTRASKA